MKKFFLTSLCLLLVMLSFTSCAAFKTLKTYEKNLGSNYDIEQLDKDDIEDLADVLDLDADDYKLKKGFEASHETKSQYVFVLQCASTKGAKDLAEDLSGNSLKVTREGRFVLIGNKDAVNKALDK